MKVYKEHTPNYFAVIMLFIAFLLLMMFSSCAVRKHQLPPVGTDMIVESVEPLHWNGTKVYYLIPVDPAKRNLSFYILDKDLNVVKDDTIRICVMKLTPFNE